jgi:hypothetical protein
MRSQQTARTLQGIGLFVLGAAVGHRLDRIFAGGDLVPNVVWIGLAFVVGAPLLWAWLRPTPPKP